MLYRGLRVDADGVTPDTDQACADESGYFVENHNRFDLSVDRNSTLKIKAGTDTYDVSLVGENYQVVVDQTTGSWSGYGYITTPSFGASTSDANRWVWFDWGCGLGDGTTGSTDPYSAAASCAGGIPNRSYRVQTNMDTGAIHGYAWNDTLGYIPFRDLTMEIPPHRVEVLVDVVTGDASQGEILRSPDNVDLDVAPMADGYDNWRIRVQFWDDTAREFLTEDDLTPDSLRFSANMIEHIFLNQVENEGDAVMVSAYNPAVGCTDSTAEYCSMSEASDGSWSANLFVFAGAPTSDMLGINSDSDIALENYTDRGGCRWIYRDQWSEVDQSTTQSNCPYLSTNTYPKSDVFYDRDANRNYVVFETLDMVFTFVSDRLVVNTVDGVFEASSTPQDGTMYTYYPTPNRDLDGDGSLDGLSLSFKPRFTTTKFVAVYDNQEYTQISSDMMKAMALKTSATVRESSAEAQAWVGNASIIKPRIDVYYQLDGESDQSVVTVDDNFLVIDTQDQDTAPDCGRRIDRLDAGTYTNVYPLVSPALYPMAYGQKSAACQGAVSNQAGINQVSNPTAEQWVCDQVSEGRFFNPSCYYTAYLNIVDRHAEPEEMKVFGAINSLLNDDTVFTNADEISVLGSTETIKLRNKMYAQIVRYMLGQTAYGGNLDSNMQPSSGLLDLMNGRLLIAQGDVIVEGSSAFNDKTLVVVGGNVYINGDVTNGRLGVIALRDGGVGGNVYVAPDVVELYANFFLDGALYSYDGTTTYEEEPSWANEETRTAVLLNQLYLNGSVVSRNTVNGATDLDGDGYYELGDGTTTQDELVAREHDLNKIREYRLCYPLDSTGLPDMAAAPEVCEGEESLLSTYGLENELYSPFILDYAPADDLPIFRSQNGLFN